MATEQAQFSSSASSSFTSSMVMQSPHKPDSPLQFTSTSAAVASFCEGLVQNFFTCQICRSVVVDPVQVLPVNLFACRRCAAENATMATTMTDLPGQLVSALREIMGRGGFDFAKNTLKENDNPITSRNGSPKATRNGAHASRDTTPVRRSTRGSASSPASPQTAALLAQLVKAEGNERTQIEEAEAGARAQVAAKLRKAKPERSAGPTSKAIKIEADKLYENADYTASVEFYTKALQIGDDTAKPKFLYGNRSAANYMAGRYEECIFDCLKTFELEPTNAKMLSRAAKAASTLGDLDRAVSLLRECPPNLLTDAFAAELSRYQQGAEILKKAEAAFGTPEGDEQYRMLVAQFRETTNFRIRLAESLMSQGRYSKGAETLDVVRGNAGVPPKALRLLAECFYKSGFEYFEKALSCLQEPAQYDAECAKLLEKIKTVNEGKHRGNTMFANQKFAESVVFYTEAIKAAEGNDEVLRILYCNRAAAHKELDHFREGIEDCTKALSVNKDFFKAYARRARCHRNLNDFFSAVQDFKRALQLEPNDTELKRELMEAERGLAKEAEREKDHYYQLGLPRTATERDIKIKYRELSLRWHPDKCVALSDAERERAEHKFKVIGESYAVLMDKDLRRKYDMELDHKERVSRAGAFQSGFANTYNSQYFRGQRNTKSGTGNYW